MSTRVAFHACPIERFADMLFLFFDGRIARHQRAGDSTVARHRYRHVFLVVQRGKRGHFADHTLAVLD